MKVLIFVLCICIVFPKNATQSSKILLGSFIQPWLAEYWDVKQFEKEFNYMKQVKMDHLIWQWIADSGSKKVWYPSRLKGYHQVPSQDILGASLEAASSKGISMWIGLNTNDEWWYHYAYNETWLNQEFTTSIALAKDIWDLYSAKYSSTIEGFYIAFEMDNCNFQTAVLQNRITKVLKELVKFVHNYTGKRIMIAPFFYDFVLCHKPMNYSKMWRSLVKEAPIDVLALQDGVGANHVQLVNVGLWFHQMSLALQDTKTELWSDLENFQYLKDKFQPAPISRVIKQIELEYPYIKRFTSFSFTHYYSPLQNHQKEFDEYLRYVKSQG